MITFQGSFKNPVYVQKRYSLNAFKNITASFVELNPTSINDKKMLEKISSDWHDGKPGGTYAVEINEMFKNAYLSNTELEILNSSKKEADERFFVITSQQHNFENLHPDKILALAKTTKEEPTGIWLDFLQVNPNNNYHSEFPVYKKVGTAIMNSLKSVFKGNRIELLSDFDAIPFYEKLGFVQVKNGKNNQLYINA